MKLIDLDKKEVVEIVGSGIVVRLTKAEEGIYLNFESEEGGRVIRIQPHEEDKKTLVLSMDKKKPTFTVVK